MRGKPVKSTRRRFLTNVVAPSAALSMAPSLSSGAIRDKPKALIAITLDLEMSRQYPTRDQTRWDFEKGNLDNDTKRYAVEAARRVKARGGHIHFFALGRTFEQENVDWIREIVREGHPVGNHTYDHVNVKATKPDQIQFRFQRAPWLIEGKSPAQVISENIRLAERAMQIRIGHKPDGFRTPGGFHDGLSDRPDVQAMLLAQGYRWVSSKYPAHPIGNVGQSPTETILRQIVEAQAQAQPFVYPSGLVEVPMSPVSDVTTLRSGRWPLDAFLEAVRRGITWAIENAAVFDFLAHPSCLVIEDPEFKTLEMIADLVQQAGERASLVDLGTIAGRARANDRVES